MSKVIALTMALITNLIAVKEPEINNPTDTYVDHQVTVKTDSRFTQKETKEEEDVPFESEFKDDPNNEYGVTKTEREGVNGKIIRTYLTTYYDGQESEKTLVSTQKIEPQNKIVTRGTKIVWKTEDADRCGEFEYWRKYESVYMTTYTPQCEGCDAWTSIGMKAGYGVIAVDPKKIPYHTKVCIPRYGIAVAGDTGGAMRSYPGLLIDLGFNSMSPQDKWLTTGRYDMYILNNEANADKFFTPTN